MDSNKLTDVAQSTAETLLEMLQILQTPIPGGSKLHKCLEEIRGVPLEAAGKHFADAGVQVNLTQDPETIIEDGNTSDEIKSKRQSPRNVVNQQQASNSKINIEKGREAIETEGSENARQHSGTEYWKRSADSDQVSPDAANKRRAQGLISAAQDAFSKGDITKAGKLANKAHKLNPSGETVNFLDKVCSKTFKINAIKKENADPNVMKKTSENRPESDLQSEKITSILSELKACLSSGRLDDAEQALRDVRACSSHPTEAVKYFESQIRAARASRSSTENAPLTYPDVQKSYPEEKTSGPDYRAKMNARFVGIARNDMAVGDYENTALDLVVQANTEIENKNMKNSEHLLVKSIDIHSTESANKLLKEEREVKLKFGQNIKYGRYPWRDEAQKCMKIAETAAKNKNFKKAEHFLEKSIRMAPSAEAKEMLQYVRVYLNKFGDTHADSDFDAQKMSNERNLTQEVHNNETDHEYLKADVEKCIIVAMSAISGKDYDKAARFLKKAQRIQPTEKAKELLEDVQEGIKQQKIQLANEEKAAPLVSLAMRAMDKELYEYAEIVLVNAWIKHKSGTAEKLINQVRDIVAQIADQSQDGVNNKRSRFIAQAHVMMSEGDLESAECVLIIALNTHATSKAAHMLSSIRYEMECKSSGEHCPLNKSRWWKYSKISKKGNKQSDALKFNSYVDMAQRAYETGYLNAAKEFLLEAEKLFRHNEIKEMLKQVEEDQKQSLV